MNELVYWIKEKKRVKREQRYKGIATGRNYSAARGDN
jgi:hypothetical protein